MFGLRRDRRRQPALVSFITRAGCTLCAEALPMVRRACGDAGIPLEVRDVDDDPADRAAWTDKVPVVLLDGVEHSFGYLGEASLRRALRGGPGPAPAGGGPRP